MMSEDKDRDILNLGGEGASGSASGMMRDEDAFPIENLPKGDVERPRIQQTEHSYFLNRFLEKKQVEASAEAAADLDTEEEAGPVSKEALAERVIDALKQIYDPEIPVNIYELGLIYDVQVEDNMAVKVIMTLTTPHCPVAESMPGEVELRTSAVKGVNGAEVQLVWDPPWDMTRMSDEARLELGLL